MNLGIGEEYSILNKPNAKKINRNLEWKKMINRLPSQISIH